MSKKPITLNYEQAKELKFFCRSVVGTRQDYYEVMDKANAFDSRLARLEKTCELIENYLGEELKRFPSFFDDPNLTPPKQDKETR